MDSPEAPQPAAKPSTNALIDVSIVPPNEQLHHWFMALSNRLLLKALALESKWEEQLIKLQSDPTRELEAKEALPLIRSCLQLAHDISEQNLRPIPVSQPEHTPSPVEYSDFEAMKVIDAYVEHIVIGTPLRAEPLPKDPRYANAQKKRDARKLAQQQEEGGAVLDIPLESDPQAEMQPAHKTIETKVSGTNTGTKPALKARTTGQVVKVRKLVKAST